MRDTHEQTHRLEERRGIQAREGYLKQVQIR